MTKNGNRSNRHVGYAVAAKAVRAAIQRPGSKASMREGRMGLHGRPQDRDANGWLFRA